jgi:hypothetical protein
MSDVQLSCSTCRWADPLESTSWTCRRFPPQVQTWVQPVVTVQDWCGEHSSLHESVLLTAPRITSSFEVHTLGGGLVASYGVENVAMPAEQWAGWATDVCKRCGHWRSTHGVEITDSGEPERPPTVEWHNGPCRHENCRAIPMMSGEPSACPGFVETA